MRLEEFIKETITQIVVGVKGAQESAVGYGAIVNPAKISGTAKGARIADNYFVDFIDFEVVLTNSNEKEDKSGVGVWLGGVGIGGQRRVDEKGATLTNIKFSVPIKLPTT